MSGEAADLQRMILMGRDIRLAIDERRPSDALQASIKMTELNEQIIRRFVGDVEALMREMGVPGDMTTVGALVEWEKRNPGS